MPRLVTLTTKVLPLTRHSLCLLSHFNPRGKEVKVAGVANVSVDRFKDEVKQLLILPIVVFCVLSAYILRLSNHMFSAAQIQVIIFDS